jgi:hypothetical protein
MTTTLINPVFISDNNTFSFKNFNTQIDVYYKNERIAILNGLSAPLQWTAKNGLNIPVKVIDQLEKMVIKLIKKSK